MIKDENFIHKGALFPPTEELERLNRYSDNKDIFSGKHCKLYQEELKRIDRVIGQYDMNITYPVLLNYQKLVSVKTADMLLSEQPVVTTLKPTNIDKIIEDSDFWSTIYEATIDVSRYGQGILCVSKDDNGTYLSLSQPKNWYPICNSENLKDVTAHVIAWIEKDDKGKGFVVQQIHHKGYYLLNRFKVSLDGYSKRGQVTVGEMVSSERYATDVEDFAIIVLSNVTSSDSIYGKDDYADINSLIIESMVRLGQISKILDMHASPSMTGSDNLVQSDPVTGGYYFKVSNFYPSVDGVKTEYITWDGKLDSAFREFELLTEQLYILSEMSKTIFDSESSGVSSGTALKFKLLSPMYKVSRLAKLFSVPLKRVIKALLDDKTILLSDIKLVFKDGLPNDETEIANIINSRVKETTLSRKTALMTYDEMTEEEANAEVDRIKGDTEKQDSMGFSLNSEKSEGLEGPFKPF